MVEDRIVVRSFNDAAHLAELGAGGGAQMT